MNSKPLINVPSLVLLLAMNAMPTLLLAADANSSGQTNPNNSMDSTTIDSTNSSNTQGKMPDNSMQTDSESIDTTGKYDTNGSSGNDNAVSSSAGSTTNSTITSTQVTNDWKTPLAAEFAKLDKTGNGLLLPNEASRGKAFNKKTFAKADADKDGTIDEQEYISFKGGESSSTMANSNKQNDVANSSMSDDNLSNMRASANSDQSNMQVSENTPAAGSSATGANSDNNSNFERPVGAVVDDTVITTKAKAKILATEDLKTLQIGVKTVNGEVTLTGTAATEAAKMMAEEVVKNVAGVKAVVNNLQVKS